MIDPYPKTLTYLEPVTVKDTSSPSTKVISNFCCSIYQWFTISICHTSRLAKSTLPWKGSKCKGQIPSCQPWREHSNACHPLHPRPKQPVFKYHINTCSKHMYNLSRWRSWLQERRSTDHGNTERCCDDLTVCLIRYDLKTCKRIHTLVNNDLKAYNGWLSYPRILARSCW